MTAIVVLGMLGALAACTTTTRASGPAADAQHETRVERPGNEASRRIEMRVKPAEPAPRDPHERGTQPVSWNVPGPFGAVVLATLGAQPQAAEQDSLAELVDAAAALAERGLEVEIVVDEYEHSTPTADTTRSSLDEQPATLATRSREAALGFTTELRRFPLPWGGEASGGGFGFEAELLGGRGVNVLHLAGAAVMALAVIPLLRTPRKWGSAAVFGGVGLGLVMTGTLVDRYPWVTLLAALALLGLLAYGAYAVWRSGRATAALDAITPVVERAPNSPELKTQIGQRAGRLLTAVKAETTASKARAVRD